MTYQNIIFLALILLIGCSDKMETESKFTYLGNWKSGDVPILITQDSFKLFLGDDDYVPLLEGKITNVDEQSDIIHFNMDDIRFSFYKLNDSAMIMLNYKTLEGIENHIDECGLIYRKNYTYPFNNQYSETHIIPKDFTGKVFINYLNQENCDLENKTFHIPTSGLHKVNCQENIIPNCLGQFRFLNTRNEVIPTISIREIKNDEFEKAMLNEIYIITYGFNQTARSLINESYNEEIEGNVYSYEVDTLKNFVKRFQ